MKVEEELRETGAKTMIQWIDSVNEQLGLVICFNLQFNAYRTNIEKKEDKASHWTDPDEIWKVPGSWPYVAHRKFLELSSNSWLEDFAWWWVAKKGAAETHVKGKNRQVYNVSSEYGVTHYM